MRDVIMIEGRERRKVVPDSFGNGAPVSERPMQALQMSDVSKDALSEQRGALFEELASVGGGIETPFASLNAMLGGGIQSGRLYLVASAPRGGKTTFASHLLDHAANAGQPCLYVGYSGSRLDYVSASLARRCAIPAQDIATGRLGTEAATTVADSLDQMLSSEGESLTLWQATAEMGVEAIADWIVAAKAEKPNHTPLVVVDPIVPSGATEASALQERAAALKDVARRHGAVILALTALTPIPINVELLAAGEDSLLMAEGLAEVAAADGVLALHHELILADSTQGGVGTELRLDPWQVAAWRLEQAGDQRRSVALNREIDESGPDCRIGGDTDGARVRLSLVRHSGANGHIFVHFRRVFAHMVEVEMKTVVADLVAQDAANPEAAAVYRERAAAAPQPGPDHLTALTSERRRQGERRQEERRAEQGTEDGEPDYRDRRVMQERREEERRA